MFLKQGEINDYLQPILTVELSNGFSFDCLFDTGFQGKLVIPRKIAEENSMTITGSETFIGAESNNIIFDTAITEINWLGDVVTLPVLVSNTTEALIGVEMLIDTVVNIDFIESKITITKPK